MEFLQDICEGRLFGSGKSNLIQFSAKDITEILYMEMLGLQILKYESGGQPVARDYIKSAITTAYDFWRTGKNELYLLIYLIIGTEDLDKIRVMLKYGEKDANFLKKCRIDKQALTRFLRSAVSGYYDVDSDRRFLLGLESGLRITDSYLKNIRRVVSNWDIQSHTTKKTTLTRLLQLFRTKARRSELLPYLESLAIAMKMEDRYMPPIKDEPNHGAQKTPVKPDLRFLRNLSAGTTAGDTAAEILRRKKKD